MKGFAVFGLLVVVLVAVSARPEEKYTDKYDNIDLDEILSNKRLLKNYTNCLLGKGNCSPDGADLKKVLPEAIKTECAKCTENQRKGSRKVLRHLIDNEPEIWAELEKEYDPSGEYAAKYREMAKKEGINI
ncbi:PREDICTED: ejaculatory bulb-specific protein 3-like [Nicrophorus vespilloides]|uniref:Ejaculatory bulb-specific protein 3-like n=1 Tax=Nicrophorus vespilloides TaxID=110193 RepID=A0ABM1MYP3_NICVS|nr:PREDICTED: ejaculatory bulb-specific protein 3-like [Nicrophorus vespilloides]